MATLLDGDKIGLSAAEIAALEEDDEGLDELKSAEESEAEEAAAKAKEKAEAEATQRADDEARAKEEADARDQAGPGFIPQLPAVDEAELQKLKDDFEDAKEKWDDGDIDYAELDVAKDAYNEARWKKDFAEESNTSMRQNRWQWEQDSFLNAEVNILYRDNETLHNAFVATVNRLITTDEGKAMSDRQVLEAAKDKVEKDLGAKPGRADQPAIPAGITDVQAADETGDKSNSFAHLDKLEGAAFQAAIDNLTPAQLRAYEDRQ